MSSALLQTFTSPLISSLPSTPTIFSEPPSESPKSVERKRTLHSLLVALNASPSPSELENCTNTFIRLEQDVQPNGISEDGEEHALRHAVAFRLLVNLYADTLGTYLNQAMRAEAEADWWRDLERSRFNISMYLLQTLPLRIANLIQMILHALRAHRLPIRLSAFSPTSLRQLFLSPKAFQAGALATALFPHLQHHPLSVTTSVILYPYSVVKKPDIIARTVTAIIADFKRFVTSLISLPMELARQECKYKRRELEKIRDQRAETLGCLAILRGILIESVNTEPQDLQSMAVLLEQTISGDGAMPVGSQNSTPGPSGFVPVIARLSSFLVTHRMAHEDLLEKSNLRRPSRLVQLWPRLLLLPPLCLYTLRYAYASRATIVHVIEDARETVVGFVRGWLIEPLKDVLRTVRAGGEDSILIRQEAVDADLHSLERMALSLARDELHYGPEQLQELSQKVKVGDLTAILQIYEDDIRHPIKSALLGSLLRSVLVQVQKAKVDIDQTLTGIDKLLKSQELTFAFVGVAPAFAIVYLVGGSVIALYCGERGRGRYGGTCKRAEVFTIMRRIERLLVSQPNKKASFNASSLASYNTVDPATAIAPLTSGLLLLAVARLRTYAETYLPVGSRLREGFLEDVADLEDPDLGRRDKLLVIERIWRCWSSVLGWDAVIMRN